MRSAWRAVSRVDASPAAARRCSSSTGTCSLTSCRRASSRPCASSAGAAALLQVVERCRCRARPAAGARPRRRSRRLRSARACSSMLRLSAASTWICCCTCVTSPRCSLARACATRTASSKLGQAAALLLGLRREQLGLLARRRRSARRCCSSSASRLAWRVDPLRVLRLQLGQARLGALAAFDHVADALLEPAHLQLRLRPARPARRAGVGRGVVRLADLFQLRLDVAQVGHARFERVGGLEHGQLDALVLARRVAVLQEPQLVQLQSCPAPAASR